MTIEKDKLTSPAAASPDGALFACVACGQARSADALPDGPDAPCADCKAEGRPALMTRGWRLGGRQTEPEPPPRSEAPQPPEEALPPGDESNFVRAGRLGGQKTRQRGGKEYFQAIGRKGGRSLAESRGPEFFRAIGKKGAASRDEARRQRRQPAAESSTLPERPDWLVNPISLDACAHSIGVPVAQLVRDARAGRLRAVERGEHWFTDAAVWAEYRAGR